MQRDIGHARKRQNQRRQYDMMRGIEQRHIGGRFAQRHRKAERKPAKPYRKHHKGNEAEPKRRRRRKHEAVALHQLVGPAVAIRARHHAQSQTQGAACDPRDSQQRKRIRRAVAQHLEHGSVKAQRRTPIALNDRCKPACVALEQRHPRAPILRKLGALRLAHAHIGGLPHVHLHRIDRRCRHKREHDEANRQHQRDETHCLSCDIAGHGERYAQFQASTLFTRLQPCP